MTIDDESPDRFSIASSCSGRLIMQTEYLREALKEFDTNSKTISFEMRREEPFFTISSEGVLGTISTEFGRSEIIESYACIAPASFTYTYTFDVSSR